MKPPAFATKLLLFVGITTLLALFMNFRLSHAGDWLPELPDQIAEGGWRSYNEPIPNTVLELLGNPRGSGRTYINPYGEWASVSVITAASFEAFHDPTICSVGQGYFLKAEARPLLGDFKGTAARVMLMRNPDRNLQALEYYWLQNDDGSTETAKRMGNYKDILARTQTGLDSVIWGHRTVLVRVFTMIPKEDINGEQSHRNILQISRALYNSFLRETHPERASAQKQTSTSAGMSGAAS